MGSPYTSVTVNNYNANPPSDDGAQTAANRVQWSTEKTKLTDPLKTAIEAVNTNISTAFAKIVGGGGVTTTAISYAVTAGDQGKLVKATASGITLTTPDATVVGSPFVCGLLNNSSGDITLDGSGSQTINGSASLTMAANDGWLLWTDGTNWFVTGRKTGVLGRGYIDGCVLSNGTDATNDINIAAGVCRDSTNAVDITVAALTKQLDANWAAGTAAGMRNSAVGIADTTYHIYAVAKADGTQDIYAHTSATVATVITALQAESGGTDYIYARIIGSIVRISGAIFGFTQKPRGIFTIKTPGLVVGSSNPGISAVLMTLAKVPTGIKLEARVGAMLKATTSSNICALVSSTDDDDVSPDEDSTVATVVSQYTSPYRAIGFAQVWTDTSARVRTRLNVSSTNDVLRLYSLSYFHPRGTDS